ncbi:MAG: hypothetical protein AAF697_05680 [Pseudomonadota bacterium]
MKTFVKIVAPLLFVTGAALPATAAVQAQSPVTLSGDVMAVEVTTDAAGNEVTNLVEPSVIVPGDRLIFGTDYANNGDEPAENFVVTNPLPAAVRLASDADPELMVSVDGGESFAPLATLTFTDENGATRAATHGDVTHVRWTLEEIAPGESGRLEYPAIIR